jgi:hypothetical protein
MGLATCQVKRTVPSVEPNALRQGSHPHTKQQTFRINLWGRGRQIRVNCRDVLVILGFRESIAATWGADTPSRAEPTLR